MPGGGKRDPEPEEEAAMEDVEEGIPVVCNELIDWLF